MESKRNAEKYQEYSTELRLLEEFNSASEKYNQGNAYARKREWDKAITAFEEAAQIWESVSAATQSENGKRASAMARQARGAADLARKYN